MEIIDFKIIDANDGDSIAEVKTHHGGFGRRLVDTKGMGFF